MDWQTVVVFIIVFIVVGYFFGEKENIDVKLAEKQPVDNNGDYVSLPPEKPVVVDKTPDTIPQGMYHQKSKIQYTDLFTINDILPEYQNQNAIQKINDMLFYSVNSDELQKCYNTLLRDSRHEAFHFYLKNYINSKKKFHQFTNINQTIGHTYLKQFISLNTNLKEISLDGYHVGFKAKDFHLALGGKKENWREISFHYPSIYNGNHFPPILLKHRDYKREIIKQFRKIFEQDKSYKDRCDDLQSFKFIENHKFKNIFCENSTYDETVADCFLFELNQFAKPKQAELLFQNGFCSFHECKNATVQDLTKIKGIGKLTAEKIIKGANEFSY